MRSPNIFISRCDLTLTESTGMLIDAAIDRAKREADERLAATRFAALEELRALQEKVLQERVLMASRQRRSRAGVAVAIAVVICLLALVGGFVAGRLIWPSAPPLTELEDTHTERSSSALPGPSALADR